MKPHFGQNDAKMNELAGIQPSCNHELVPVSECEKCGNTFDTVLPDSDCDRLRDKLRYKTEFCRICGGDALKEIETLQQLEKQYAKTLGRLAELCACCVPALLAPDSNATVTQAIAAEEIMQYVNSVRP